MSRPEEQIISLEQFQKEYEFMAEQVKGGEIIFPKGEKLSELLKEREEIKDRLDKGRKDELEPSMKVNHEVLIESKKGRGLGKNQGMQL